MSKRDDLDSLPDDLPVPDADGACDHLAGRLLPSIALPATDGSTVDLSALSGRTVVFVYPRTGQPGRAPLIAHWDEVPGARGCTPQTCAFRDRYAEFAERGCRVLGLSTQDTAYQREMASRLRLPFAVLSDADLALTRSLSLPTFEAAGETLLKRMAWVLDDGRIVKVFYPVFPPDQNAATVLDWIASTS